MRERSFAQPQHHFSADSSHRGLTSPYGFHHTALTLTSAAVTSERVIGSAETSPRGLVVILLGILPL
jgi:hypothetical protein